jgi:predicted RNase H-like HicB family nuclease
MENKFTAVFEHVGEWWIGYIEELPGANTQGRTLEEARENLKEAAHLIIEANRKTTSVPRHSEIVDKLAIKICKDLDIPNIAKIKTGA